jgi:hypothetical protein
MARMMYKMTGKINKKYFREEKDEKTGAPALSCVTCHHGSPHPEAAGHTEVHTEGK